MQEGLSLLVGGVKQSVLKTWQLNSLRNDKPGSVAQGGPSYSGDCETEASLGNSVPPRLVKREK